MIRRFEADLEFPKQIVVENKSPLSILIIHSLVCHNIYILFFGHPIHLSLLALSNLDLDQEDQKTLSLYVFSMDGKIRSQHPVEL